MHTEYHVQTVSFALEIAVGPPSSCVAKSYMLKRFPWEQKLGARMTVLSIDYS